MRPVNKPALEGEQFGAAEWQSVKRIPSAANWFMFGVLIRLP
jgi:hypothetical protein